MKFTSTFLALAAAKFGDLPTSMLPIRGHPMSWNEYVPPGLMNLAYEHPDIIRFQSHHLNCELCQANKVGSKCDLMEPMDAKECICNLCPCVYELTNWPCSVEEPEFVFVEEPFFEPAIPVAFMI